MKAIGLVGKMVDYYVKVSKVNIKDIDVKNSQINFIIATCEYFASG